MIPKKDQPSLYQTFVPLSISIIYKILSNNIIPEEQKGYTPQKQGYVNQLTINKIILNSTQNTQEEYVHCLD